MPSPILLLIWLPNWAQPLRLGDWLLFLLVVLGIPLFIRFVRSVEDHNYKWDFLNAGYLEQWWQRTLHDPGAIEQSTRDYEIWCETWHAISAGDYSEAVQLLDQLRKNFPVEPGLLALHAVCLAHIGRHADAEETFALLISVPTLGMFSRVRAQIYYLELLLLNGQFEKCLLFANSLMSSPQPYKAVLPLDAAATHALVHRRLELFLAADAWTAFNCKTVPSSLTLKGSRGAILFELGRKDEAELLLEKVRTCSTADVDRGITSYYLALLRFEQGKPEQACPLLLHARLYYPQPWLIDRVRKAQLDHLDLPLAQGKNRSS